ncbi:hypothetical protein ABPG75_011785 [Micractinium tetrahymenae]
MKLRRVVQDGPALSRVVAVAWAALACALVAEFSRSSWIHPHCAGSASGPAGSGSGAAAANRTAAPPPAAPGTGPGWQEVDALIQQGPARHGKQVKQPGGVPANLTLLLVHMTNHDANLHGVPAGIGPGLFRWFAHAHTFNKSAGQSNRLLQSPVPACHFYVDHRYRILYIRNTKTAGTSISSMLGMKENPMACLNPQWCYAKCKGKRVCMEYLWDEKELRRVFQEYTVFAFVRNPWSRAISSWHHVDKYGLRQECQDSFGKFAEVPSAYGAKCLAYQGKCCRKRFGWILEHIEPQTRCLFTAEGQPVVDFIGRVENVDEDMQALLDLVNSRRPMGTEALTAPPLPKLMVAADELSGKEEERRRRYAQLYMNNTALEDIRRYFHRDFTLLQYNSSIPWAESGIDGGIVLGDAAGSLAVLGSSTSSLADAAGGGVGGDGGQQSGAAADGAGGGSSGTGQQAELAAAQGFPDPREMAMKG